MDRATHYRPGRESSSRLPLQVLLDTRHLFRRLRSELTRAQRYRRSVAVIVLSLDALSPEDPCLTTPAGRGVEADIARRIRDLTRRDIDSVGRVNVVRGMPGFAVLLPECGYVEGQIVLGRIRDALRRLFPEAGVREKAMSFGAASFTGTAQSEGMNASDFLRAAERSRRRSLGDDN